MLAFKLLLWILTLRPALAATCSLSPSYKAPSLASGWSANLVSQNVSDPRSILRDSQGNLLVLLQGSGIVHLRLDDGGGDCVDVVEQTTLVNNNDLNHGLALSDGSVLYASSSDAVYAYVYDAEAPSLSASRTILTGMLNAGHTTRTLLLPRKVANTLVVSRGSNGNIDIQAADVSSGHAQLKAFDISRFNRSASNYDDAASELDFNSDGILLGWGLRNSVGVAEHPQTGGIHSVENSADDIKRLGEDVHTNNPGEEMNYHGILSSSSTNSSQLQINDAASTGTNYGYPSCFAAWKVSDLPENSNLTTGMQFALDVTDATNDRICAEQRTGPRLTFQAHMAPLDIKFTTDGGEAFISFHGSWNRSPGVGYKVSSVAFNGSSGDAIPARDSTDAALDIMTNADDGACPNDCFRPAGLWVEGSSGDAEQQRVWMTSDSTNEVWVLHRAAGGSGGASGSGSDGGSGDQRSSATGNTIMNQRSMLFIALVLGMALVWNTS